MREEFNLQLRKGLLKSGLIAGIVTAFIFAAMQILIWFLEKRTVTDLVVRTRGISTYGVMAVSIIIVMVVQSLQLSVKAAYLNQFYVNRTVLSQVKRYSIGVNSVILSCITLAFQILYGTTRCENLILVMSLQFLLNVFFYMAIVVWADNSTMISPAVAGLYITIFAVILIRQVLVYRSKVDFLITDTKTSLIWVVLCVIMTVTGIYFNQKLTAKEDCVKGVEADD